VPSAGETILKFSVSFVSILAPENICQVTDKHRTAIWTSWALRIPLGRQESTHQLGERFMRHITSARLRVSVARKVKLNYWGMTLCATMVGLSTVTSLSQPAPNAHPTGGTVVAGQASITMSPGVVNITSTTLQAVIDWQSFDIGSHQQVVFTGPSANATVLNRVTRPNPSQISGQLSSNGQVYVVNASGVTYYQGAEVDVSGFVSTSTDISNQNFLGGQLVFDQPGNPLAEIVNGGEISVSDRGAIAFVAPGVRNSGVIRAPRGSVGLGSSTTFNLDANGNLGVTGQLTSLPPDPGLVVNTGTIRARGGRVWLLANVAAGVGGSIRVGGVVRTKTANAQLGQIVVQGVGAGAILEGTLDASGEKAGDLGGNVQVLGVSSTELRAMGVVDVSGEAGAGAVAIGTTLARALGGPSVTPQFVSNTSSVDQGAEIMADALAAGNGGRVVVLASSATTVAGSISAAGGNPSGNGGLVEISGAFLSLLPSVDVDTSAPFGLPGSFILDPYDFSITRPMADALSAQLSSGTTGKLTIQADHDIIVDATIDGRGGKPGTQLVLNAGNQVRLNANVFTNNAPIEVVVGHSGILPSAGTVFCAGTSTITVRWTGISGLSGNETAKPTCSLVTGSAD
jgi:filamentous hemagglutinin family protein